MNNTELYIQSLHLLKTKANEPIIEGLIKGFSIIMESYGIETPNTNISNPLDVAKATFENMKKTDNLSDDDTLSNIASEIIKIDNLDNKKSATVGLIQLAESLGKDVKDIKDFFDNAADNDAIEQLDSALNYFITK
jgi:methyltransferase-like protein